MVNLFPMISHAILPQSPTQQQDEERKSKKAPKKSFHQTGPALSGLTDSENSELSVTTQNPFG